MHLDNLISQSEVSIVIQGGILNSSGELDNDFIFNLDLILKNFPQSEIIVSTWKTDDVTQNKLIISYPGILFLFNEDVGSISENIDGVNVVSNVNRMLVSSLNGLRFASKKYSIKIRTDSYLYNDNILSCMSDYFLKNKFLSVENILRQEEYTVFSRHLINCNLFARNPYSHLPFLYHPGDIMVAGLTQDVLNFFDIPLAEESIFKHCRSMMNACYMRFVPEQYVWIKNLERSIHGFKFPGNFSRNAVEVERSEKMYLNNFLPLDSARLGFVWRKHKEVYFNKGWSSLYQPFDWIYLYSRYIRKQKYFRPLIWSLRFIQIMLMKIYFFIRTQLLKLPCVRKIAYRLFVKRGN
ncbi:WavE lipopolysaccharide synthesis [Rosenbergiella australiborealis]|uniref:WavE lipopolysaccharide synthesis n=1 Tax=Rosenbergiella australiborealis TaxID=1544696 RepID=A0ABS5T3D8_9GAMM|nr:WavE lipopolysaccharide synthesis family protein [Rosenbergiella australiborealis]MBT0725942.1 WavE lipopolysaccharide synthesis [Rosenbergiella australiborealis]